MKTVNEVPYFVYFLFYTVFIHPSFFFNSVLTPLLKQTCEKKLLSLLYYLND